MYLTDKLAAQIIESIMRLVGYSIYITDKDGLVLAAKNCVDIGTFNLLALQAVQTETTQLVFPGQESLHQAASPGIVMPLQEAGYVIGTLGMVGHPDQIKDAAVLAKKVIELLIERETLQQEVSSKYHLRDQFIGLVIAGSTTPQDIIRLADILRFDLSLPRTVVVINILPKQLTRLKDVDAPGYYGKASELARSLVQNSTFVTSSDLVGIWDRRLLILKHIPGKTQKLDQWCTDLIYLLTSNINDTVVQVGVGGFVEVHSSLPESYQQARFCLRNCAENWFASIYDFAFLADYLLENTTSSDTIHPIKMLVNKIAAERLREKYDIDTTVLALIANNFGLVPTAKALYIHRNTLLSRLSKLKEITGLDPVHSFAHAVICKVLFGTVVSR